MHVLASSQSQPLVWSSGLATAWTENFDRSPILSAESPEKSLCTSLARTRIQELTQRRPVSLLVELGVIVVPGQVAKRFRFHCDVKKPLTKLERHNLVLPAVREELRDFDLSHF